MWDMKIPYKVSIFFVPAAILVVGTVILIAGVSFGIAMIKNGGLGIVDRDQITSVSHARARIPEADIDREVLATFADPLQRLDGTLRIAATTFANENQFLEFDFVTRRLTQVGPFSGELAVADVLFGPNGEVRAAVRPDADNPAIIFFSAPDSDGELTPIFDLRLFGFSRQNVGLVDWTK